MPRQDGNPHAGNAALALAMPLLVCLALAVLGFVLSLTATIWAQTQDPLKVPGLGWITWGCAAMALLWVVGAVVFLLFPRTNG